MFNSRFRTARLLNLPLTLAALAACTLIGCNGEDVPSPGPIDPQEDNAEPASVEQSPDQQPEPVDDEQETGQPALFDAVVAADAQQVRQLLEQGADPNEMGQGTRGRFAPIHVAVRLGDMEILQSLIDAGADVNIRADAGHRSPPLIWAVRWGHLDVVKLLVENGAELDDVGGVGEGFTALKLAVDTGEHDIAAYLEDQGAAMVAD